MSSRKRAMRDVYFDRLEYSAMCFAKAWASESNLSDRISTEKILQCLRQGAAQKSLRGSNMILFILADRWIWLNLQRRLCTGLNISLCEGKQTVDNEVALRAYRMFRNFEVYEGTKTSIMSTARLDEVMATIVDLLTNAQEMNFSKII